MPGRKASKDSRVAQILRAGHHVASRVGLDRLTVRLVAAKAKLSSGLVLFYFKTKERLLTALLSDLLESTTVLTVSQEVARIKSPLARLRALVRREMARLSSEPGRVRLFLEFWVKGIRHPEIRAGIRAEQRRYREGFRPMAEAVLASQPERFPNISADSLAAVAVGVVEGYAVQSVIEPGKLSVDEYALAAKNLLEGPAKNAT